GGDDTIEVWLDTTLLTAATWVAAANIENVVLMGEYNSNATGNKLDNMLLGNSGNNVLNGDAGADFMAGGAGDDTYDIDSSDTVFEESNEGTDTVKANFSYTLNDNFENLILTSKMADNATGNGLANQLTGNDMANTLNGKAGNDTLVGGLGNDIFRFDTDLSSNTDTIQDFVVGQDRISLENSIFKGLALGKLKAANFASGSVPVDANDYIIYDATTGNLYYDADGNGGGTTQHFATLVGMPALTVASFIVT
ncbi:MAG: M10 family metallopeptidase C-terminal domain-containing protein, partial [Macromonas sp.]